MAIFPTFFLRNRDQENVFYDILEQKNFFLGYKNKKFKKSKHWHFSKGVSPWFWSKNGLVFNFFFRQYRPRKCILWYYRTNKHLSRLKKQKDQKVEKLTFSKGVNSSFFSKNGHFSNLFFLRNIDRENVFYDILERKNFILGFKNKKFKKLKNWHFSRGVNPWFWSKNGHFSNFLF